MLSLWTIPIALAITGATLSFAAFTIVANSYWPSKKHSNAFSLLMAGLMCIISAIFTALTMTGK